MNEKQSAFLEKLNTLPLEDLIKYKSATVQAMRIIDAIGIICILMMFIFPMTLILIFCIPFVYFLAKTGSNIHISLLEITDLIQKRATGRG